MAKLFTSIDVNVAATTPIGPVCHLIAQRSGTVLQSSSYRSLRGLSCEYHEGVLTIRGSVPTYYLKQMAQSLLIKLEGVEEIDNRVEVTPSGRPASW